MGQTTGRSRWERKKLLYVTCMDFQIHPDFGSGRLRKPGRVRAALGGEMDCCQVTTQEGMFGG